MTSQRDGSCRGELFGDGVADGGQIGGRGQDRGVVGVVRRPEEDGGRRIGHRPKRSAGLVADGRPSRHVSGLELVAVHQRRDADDVVRGGLVHDHERLVMGGLAVGVPPGPLDAVARERGRGGGAIDQRVPDLRGDRIEGAAPGHEHSRPRMVFGGRRCSRVGGWRDGLCAHGFWLGRHRCAPGQRRPPSDEKGMITSRE